MAILNIISDKYNVNIDPFTTSNNIIQLGNTNLKVSQYSYNKSEE